MLCERHTLELLSKRKWNQLELTTLFASYGALDDREALARFTALTAGQGLVGIATLMGSTQLADGERGLR